MPILSVEIIKIINKRESVMQGVLQWDEVIVKCK